MARQNYGYEKRQKELAKQKKREEKWQRKLNKKSDLPEESMEQPPAEEESQERIKRRAGNIFNAARHLWRRAIVLKHLDRE